MAGTAWTKEQMRGLIDIYREEPCLYAVKHPNYHNKNLRNVALEMVSAVVRQLSPNVTAKECQAKIHTLRNQFNIENAKRRSSLNKSGNGAADVYVPSLWYFNILSFLDEHYVPRKSKSSRIGTATGEDTGSQCMEASVNVTSQGFDDNGVLRVFSEDDSESDETQFIESQIQSPESPFQGSRSSSPSILTPLRPLVTSTQINEPSRPQSAPPQSQSVPTPMTPSPSLTQSQSTPSPSSTSSTQSSSTSSFLLPTHRPNKRKKNEDAAFVGAINAIAETLKEPTPASPPPAETNPVDACMNFLGSMLKTFRNKSRQIDVMNKLVQTVLTAKSEEESGI